jgi:hypothetical protein
MNSTKDASKDEDICIVDDTCLSCSSTSSVSSRINYTNGNNEFEQNQSNSLSKSNSNLDEDNFLDKNIELIDVTMSSNDSKTSESHSSKTNNNSYKDSSDLVEDKSKGANKLDSFSRKRKSIDIIDLDENLDQKKVEKLQEKRSFDHSKKFKMADTSNIICLDDEDDDYKDKKIEHGENFTEFKNKSKSGKLLCLKAVEISIKMYSDSFVFET